MIMQSLLCIAMLHIKFMAGRTVNNDLSSSLPKLTSGAIQIKDECVLIHLSILFIIQRTFKKTMQECSQVRNLGKRRKNKCCVTNDDIRSNLYQCLIIIGRCSPQSHLVTSQPGSYLASFTHRVVWQTRLRTPAMSCISW